MFNPLSAETIETMLRNCSKLKVPLLPARCFHGKNTYQSPLKGLMIKVYFISTTKNGLNIFNFLILFYIYLFLNRTGELMNRLSSDCQVLQNALSVSEKIIVFNTLSCLKKMVFLIDWYLIKKTWISILSHFKDW